MTTPEHPASSSSPPATPQSLEDLLLHALAMEREAVSRYNELADMMEVHNNGEVAELFRKMAEYEARHVAQVLDELGHDVPEAAPGKASAWTSVEGPESVPIDEMHYLMQPWHALRLAHAAEQRARTFFDDMARNAGSDDIRRAAEAMRDEEAEHVALIEAWMAKVPRPESDWAVDPDPPRFID